MEWLGLAVREGTHNGLPRFPAPRLARCSVFCWRSRRCPRGAEGTAVPLHVPPHCLPHCVQASPSPFLPRSKGIGRNLNLKGTSHFHCCIFPSHPAISSRPGLATTPFQNLLWDFLSSALVTRTLLRLLAFQQASLFPLARQVQVIVSSTARINFSFHSQRLQLHIRITYRIPQRLCAPSPDLKAGMRNVAQRSPRPDCCNLQGGPLGPAH